MSKIKHFRIYWANSSFPSAIRGTTIQAAIKRAGFHPDVLAPNDIVMEGEKETFEFDAAKNAYVDVSVSHRWDEATRTWIKIDRDAETHSSPDSGLAERVAENIRGLTMRAMDDR